MRAVLELAGIHDILEQEPRARRTRSTSSRRRSPASRACARRDEVAQLRGLSINEVLGLSQGAGGGEHIAAEPQAEAERSRPRQAAGGRRGRRRSTTDEHAEGHPGQVAQRLDQASIATLRSLGLRRIGHTVDVNDTPQARGMIHAVRHLVRVEEDGS